jgi:hypothetical protein
MNSPAQDESESKLMLEVGKAYVLSSPTGESPHLLFEGVQIHKMAKDKSLTIELSFSTSDKSEKQYRLTITQHRLDGPTITDIQPAASHTNGMEQEHQPELERSPSSPSWTR